MSNISPSNEIKTLIQIRKSLERSKTGNIQTNQALWDFLEIQKKVTDEFKRIDGVIEAKMREYGVTKIIDDRGHILIAERKTFKESGAVAPRFFKKTIDNAKVSAYYKLMNKVPNGIELVTTSYLTKKIKAGI